MTNVIEFPSHDIREWTDIERTLRDLFKQNNGSIEMEDEVISQMKEFYKLTNEKFSFSYELPSRISDEVRESIDLAINRMLENFAKGLHDLMTIIFFDRFQLEIQIYKLIHGE